MLKYITLIIALLTIILFLTKEHFILGSVFLFSRWIFLFILIIGVFVLLKSNLKKISFIAFFAIFILLADWGYTHFLSAKPFAFKASQQTKNLTVLTFNLYFRISKPKTNINTILKYDADLVFCQEITPEWGSILDKSLKEIYPYSKVIVLKGTHGIGIYSKYPLSDDYPLNNAYELPFAHMVTVNHPSGEIYTANAHWASPAVAFADPPNFVGLYRENAKQRKNQWNIIKQEMDKHSKDSPKIIAGDLNTLNYEPLYNHIIKDFVDAHSVAGTWPGLTFPNTHKLPFKTARLDYIMLQGKIEATKTEVAEKSSSDHFAIYLEMKIM